MDDLPPRKDSSPVIGQDLYGLSLHELEQRIVAYKAEIARIETELSKKSQEQEAANALFNNKST